jgi:hypothetical protein
MERIAQSKRNLASDPFTSAAQIKETEDRVLNLRNLIREEILSRLNSGSEKPADLYLQIRPILEDRPDRPVGVVARRLNGVDAIVIGYSLLFGSSGLPSAATFVEGFRKEGAQYFFADGVGDKLAVAHVQINELHSPWSSELWLLTHGQQTGVMQYHERIAIYSFDGFRFKTLWTSREPKKAPEFEIAKAFVKVTYELEPPEFGPRQVEQLDLTPGGIIENAPLPQHPITSNKSN